MVFDPQKGHRPRAVVVIGGEVVLCKDYQISASGKGEASTASATIPLENIAAEIFADESVVDNIHEVEIWAGYLKDDTDPEKQLREIRDKILGEERVDLFTRRFSGYISQPEWNIGSNGRFLNISCIDWSSLLRENEYDANFTGGGACEVKNIVSTLQKDLSGLEIIVDSYPGSVRLGEKDDESGEYVYNSLGKKYWDILKDCADKLGYIIITDGATIRLTYQNDNPLIWPIFYGPAEKNNDGNGNPVGLFFDNLQFRYGQKWRVEKSNIVIEASGVKTPKGAKSEAVKVTYPSDAQITSNTKLIKVQVPGNTNETKLKIHAENEYRKNAARLVTGNFDLPFANQYLSLHDIIEVVTDEPELKFLNGYWFNIVAFSESFSVDGFTQNIEFESDPTLKNRVEKKIAPKYDHLKIGLVSNNGSTIQTALVSNNGSTIQTALVSNNGSTIQTALVSNNGST